MTDNMKKPEVVSPAGNLPCLKAAVDAGADAVYVGFNDSTNARNFEGLNFTQKELETGIGYAKGKGRKVFIAINTFPQLDNCPSWHSAVDRAVGLNADAVIIANLGILKYARDKYPDLNIHLSTQASSSNHESINFYRKHFGIKRVVLPRGDRLRIQGLSQRQTRESRSLPSEARINIEEGALSCSLQEAPRTRTARAPSGSSAIPAPDGAWTSPSIMSCSTGLHKAKHPHTTMQGRYIMPDGKPFYAFEEPES